LICLKVVGPREGRVALIPLGHLPRGRTTAAKAAIIEQLQRGAAEIQHFDAC
jgi:hypothetical protein